MTIPRLEAQLLTVEQIADLFCDTVNNVQGYVRRDAIPYVVIPDGIVIPLHGFQMCCAELYDLAADLRAMDEAILASEPLDDLKIDW